MDEDAKGTEVATVVIATFVKMKSNKPQCIAILVQDVQKKSKNIID